MEDNQLQTKDESGVEKYDSDMLKKARAISGEGSGMYIPYIPRVRINNKKEKKMANIDGVEKEVEILPDAGFLITVKTDNNEYVEQYFGKELKGGILKARFKIMSGYEQEPSFASDEFDYFSQVIKLHSMKDWKEIIAEGTYSELKEMFKTGRKNKVGRDEVSFSTSVVLYINVANSQFGEIFRFEWKLGASNNWFDYKASFGQNDTYVAHETVFNLQKGKTGENEYWFATAEKGEQLDLTVQLEKQMEIQKFFMAVNNIKDNKPAQQAFDAKETVIDVDEEDKELEQRIKSIPF